uniref:Uncharacterized protein n=1 Tax=Anguilla anguilla TaxID=7936 RepID=A0A0E9U8I4_ANGAN
MPMLFCNAITSVLWSFEPYLIVQYKII